MQKMKPIDIKEKLAQFSEYWSPKIIGELNGQVVKVAKLKGEFIWHHHEHEDEMFMVVEGTLVIKLKDGEVELNEGQFYIIPKGVEHMPVAIEECHVMLFEPKSVLNTGNVINERTVEKLDKI